MRQPPTTATAYAKSGLQHHNRRRPTHHFFQADTYKPANEMLEENSKQQKHQAVAAAAAAAATASTALGIFSHCCRRLPAPYLLGILLLYVRGVLRGVCGWIA